MPGQAKFGLLKYLHTDNIGDEIQSLAVRRFLPRVDYYIDREEMNSFVSSEGPVWTVLNGWYCHKPENWPPSEHLSPLILSFHVSLSPSPSVPTGLRPTDAILSEPAVNYLRGFGPIGARDQVTLERLNKVGVDAYFSGCMTLTLERPDVERREDLVVLCDVPPAVADHVARTTKKKIEHVSHSGFGKHDHEARFAHAEAMLKLYARASCVVTNRLHCALPCIAMGSPVLLLDTAPDPNRFAGLSDFVRHDTVNAFISGRVEFNLEQPPPNPDRHRPVREALSKRVSEFVQAAIDGRQPPPHPLSLSDRHQALSLTLSRLSAAMLLKYQRLEKLTQKHEQLVDALRQALPRE